MNIIKLVIVVIVLLIKDFPLIFSLQFRRLSIPGAIQSGASLWIHCDYDLQDDKLYSLKFYKNSQEFYCYSVPENKKPENKYFPQNGIYLDLHRSNATHIFLTKTDLNTEGTYGCEVTTYLFQTFYKERDLRVYVLPVQNQLQIVSHEWEYKIGDHINVTCISPPSRPSVSLAWYINGVLIKEVDESYKLSSDVIEQDSNNLITSLLTIEFVVNSEQHLANGVLTLQCTGIIWQIYGVPFEEIRIEEHGTVKINKIGENYDKIIINDDLRQPKISSKHREYKIGDIVDVNCMLKPVPPYQVYLEWFINEKPAESTQIIAYSSSDVFGQIFTNNYSQSSISELKFRITKKHYQTKDNALKLRCLAIHGKIIWQDSIQLVLFDTSRQTSHLNFDSKLKITMWTFFAVFVPFFIT